ncbi:MAG: molybdopterin molybdotransferase MoeA [Daejeonella sp.]
MPPEFIDVAEAKKLINEHTELLSPVKVHLKDAAGLALFEDVFSRTDVPPFNQSSMDGYAFNFAGWKKFGELKIEGIIAAGLVKDQFLEPQNAVRIFTGAAIPEGADTVVMQEKTKVVNGKLQIEDSNLTRGINFRPKGSEIHSGDLALEKNSNLSPAALGFLAGVGIHELNVYPVPAVSIILTGNELQNPGILLKYGEVYESNSYSLRAALKKINIDKVNILSCEDTLEILSKVLSEALTKSDVVLLTGGVSVGDYDFVIRAAAANGIDQIFHKIKQKPGKPLYFGKKDKKLVFGLPGNPASVLNCFYEYVLPAVGKMSMRDLSLKTLHVPLQTVIKKPSGLTQFLKGFYNGISVSDLKAQESFRLSSFAKANCLIRLDEEKTEFEMNEIVEIHLLPE